MKTRKIRRNSGRVEANSTLLHEMKKRDIINQCLEPQEYWDDWNDYRDGQRDRYRDGSKIKGSKNNLLIEYKHTWSNVLEYHYKWRNVIRERILSNLKNLKMIRIRQARKNGRFGNIV